MIGLHDIGMIESPYSDLASILGYGLGSGARGLYDQSQKPGKIQDLMNLYGLNQDKASALYGQPRDMQKQYLQGFQKQQQRQKSIQGLQNIIAGLGSSKDGIPDELQTLLQSAGLDMPERQMLDRYLKSQQRERQHQEKQLLKEREMAERQEERVAKYNKPYVDELYKDYKTAKHERSVLGQMRAASKTGKFSSPARQALQDFFHTDFDFLRTDDDIIWRKLQNEFLPKMKTLFGGKVSDKEMAQFMKGVPSLTQSKEGREKLIDMLELYTKIPEERYKTFKKVSKTHKGRDLRERVDDASEDRIDSIRNELIEMAGLRPISDKDFMGKSGGKQKKESFEESIFNLAKGAIEPELQGKPEAVQSGQRFESIEQIPITSEPVLVEDEDTGRQFYIVNGQAIPIEEFK